MKSAIQKNHLGGQILYSSKNGVIINENIQKKNPEAKKLNFVKKVLKKVIFFNF